MRFRPWSYEICAVGFLARGLRLVYYATVQISIGRFLATGTLHARTLSSPRWV